MGRKIGRNEPCPCGSGKKYKKCCKNSGRSFDDHELEIKPSTIFNKYNSIDLIKTFAGIALFPENHGKNIRLEELTKQAILNYNQVYKKVPSPELQSFLNENFPSHHMEDIPTNLFTDLVTFHRGDYLIFPGITEGGSYVLSNLLIAIYNWPDSDIPDMFRINCLHVSLLILNLSNAVIKKLGYPRYMKGSAQETHIQLPSASLLEEAKSAITFTKAEVNKMIQDKEIAPEVLQRFLLDMNDPSFKDIHSQENQILLKPILYHNGEYIITSPATLSYALVEFILSHAKEFGILSLVSKAYHDTIWNFTQLHLGQIGFSVLDLPSIINNENIRNNIYRFDDDKLAYIEYLCDVGKSKETLETSEERKHRIIHEILALDEYADHHFMDINLISMLEEGFVVKQEITQNSLSIYMPIHDFDTLVKLKKHSALNLWKFTQAKNSKLADSPLMKSSFLDLFKLYKDNDDSFYISDEDPDFKLMIKPGYAYEFYQKAILLSDEHSALRKDNERIAYVPVIRKDIYAPIYYSVSDIGKHLQYLVEGFHQPIWVSPTKSAQEIPEELRHLYMEMTDAIAYWLWQCQDSIRKDLSLIGEEPIIIYFDFDNEKQFSEIERNFERDPMLPEKFIVTASDYAIKLTIPALINPYLYGPDNEGERILLRQILLGLNKILIFHKKPSIEDIRISQIIETAAPLGAKKKIFLIDTSDNLLLDPSNLDKYRFIQDYDINVVLDNLVSDLGQRCPNVGEINIKSDKTKLTRDVVMRVLLPKLQRTISQYKNESLLIRLISLNESLIHKREELRLLTPTRIACFVSVDQQTLDLQESLTKLNQTTIAVRCLIEHIAAEPAVGSKIVSTTAIDELIAIMNSIIDWGSLGDQIEFDLFGIDLSILPSGRIGVEKSLSKEIFDPYNSSKSKENVQNALDTFEQVFPQINPKEKKEIPANLDQAFLEEFGLTFTRIAEFINDLGLIAYKQTNPYATSTKDKLFIEINKFDHTYTEEEFNAAMDFLCLKNRGKVQVIPDGYDGFDISPWRFNRRLSLLRKPLVAVNSEGKSDNPIIYWGFRQLLSSRLYLNDQLTSNRLKVLESGPVQKVMGKLIQQNGKQLVKSVIKELKEDQLIIDSEVSIGPKSTLKNEKDIGDIDVLVIDKLSKTVYNIECKSMAPSRNIKEMIEEVSKLFGSNSKKGWIEKHSERDEWLKNNLELVGAKYGLDLSKYNVKSFFLTQEDMLTPYLKTRQLAIPFVTLYKLKEKGLNVFK